MLNDPMANALSVITNSEQRVKTECAISPVSKLIESVLKLMQDNKYIGEVKKEETARGRRLTVSLLGTINACGAIKPRYAVQKATFEQFEKRFLPASGFGMLIVSTPKGVMTHTEAKKKGVGGRLIAYCY